MGGTVSHRSLRRAVWLYIVADFFLGPFLVGVGFAGAVIFLLVLAATWFWIPVWVGALFIAFAWAALVLVAVRGVRWILQSSRVTGDARHRGPAGRSDQPPG
jgi:hypothetical protein